jgi:hypothetical protein
MHNVLIHTLLLYYSILILIHNMHNVLIHTLLLYYTILIRIQHTLIHLHTMLIHILIHIHTMLIHIHDTLQYWQPVNYLLEVYILYSSLHTILIRIQHTLIHIHTVLIHTLIHIHTILIHTLIHIHTILIHTLIHIHTVLIHIHDTLQYWQPVNYLNHLKLADVLYSLDDLPLARKYYAQVCHMSHHHTYVTSSYRRNRLFPPSPLARKYYAQVFASVLCAVKETYERSKRALV